MISVVLRNKFDFSLNIDQCLEEKIVALSDGCPHPPMIYRCTENSKKKISHSRTLHEQKGPKRQLQRKTLLL